MSKKIISCILALMLLLSCMTGMSFSAAAADAGTDNTALIATLDRIRSYDEADYTAESYAALSALYDTYSANYASFTTQEEIDNATAALLEAISGLRACLRLSVKTNVRGAALGVSYGETVGGAGTYTVVYGTPVTLTAPALEGYTFAGWFETVSKRFLSEDSTYSFDMTVKTSLTATYYSNASAVLRFCSIAGQVFATYEKTAAEWAATESLDALAPASVPYRYGYTDGAWNIPADALSQLQAGEDVTVTPQFQTAAARTFAPAAVPAEGIALELHYRYDATADIGSFVMRTAPANGVQPESFGMLFYYIDADSDFYIDAFDVNINNKMLTSQFNIKNDDTYITNMKKLSRHIWAVKGYATYKVNGESVVVYSNQVNVVSTVDRHKTVTVEENRTEPTCTADGSYDKVQYCYICGDEISRTVNTIDALGHHYEIIGEQAPTCTEAGSRAIQCSECFDTYVEDIPALGHDYAVVYTEDAACTDDGVTVYECTRCSDTYSDVIPALGHDWTEWAETQAGTCTEKGIRSRECTRCDAVEEEQTDYDYSNHHYLSETYPATCEDDGYTEYTCTRCGDHYTADITPATGHTYVLVDSEEATCTADGFNEYTCSVCGDNYTETVAALGHDYVIVGIGEATCTADGGVTYQCSRCGDTYTDVTPATGHTAGSPAEENRINPECTTDGSYDTVVYCTVCGAELSRETTTLPATGHSWHDWTVTTPAVEATCTAAGTTAVETRECVRCGATETRGGATVAALGHDYQATVTEATCTQGGFTTYTCSRCGDSYSGGAQAPLGHDLGAWTVVTPAAIGQTGEQRRYCTRCDYYESETIPALTAGIEVKLPNVDSYLYRAGNANNIALGSLFQAAGPNAVIDSAAVTATVTNVAGSAAGTFTANTSDWTAATVKLTGTGVVTVAVKQSGTTVATLYLEVVVGTNYAEGATLGNVSSNNAVLLGDVVVPSKITISNKKTLFGNGFSVTDTRTNFTNFNTFINMSGGGTIDNAKLLGAVYQEAVTSGIENNYYAPGVWITGDANIYNSYVSETKNAVQIDSGNVYFENTTFSGGAIANIDIGGGDVTLKNCITQTSDRGGLKGLGVRARTSLCKIRLEGTFTQYNYLKKTDLPSTYSSILSSLYNNTTYAYTYDGSTYLNMGVFFVADSSITQAMAQTAIVDNTGNNYGYLEKTTVGITGTIYTLKAASATPSLLSAPAYDETVNGQYPIPAAYSFDYTTKNYIAKTAGSNLYCYYDTTTEKVEISFDKENTSSSFTWDPMILTATKNGNTLPYTVSMNGTDYTNQSIVFTESGDYTVTYTYTDPYNYGLAGAPYSKTYTKTVNINVTAVEPDVQTYPCAFNYDGAAGNYNAKQVIGTDSKTYVMPDVSSTSSTIGSTTVAGKTVYYPIVNVGPTTSNGNTAYSSGKGYYFAPVFSEIHIRDYNQETGAQQYEYSKSTTTWPHGQNATSGPNTAYFTCASGEKVWGANSPYARSTNAQYYKYNKNNLGVCYTTCEIEKDNSASNHLVQYHYVSNDGTTYYYYVYYKFAAMTYASCVTDGTPVTMADGTTKPIEDVRVGDMVMTWSIWNGCYEAQPVVMHWYHGTDEWRVLTLTFSDGTEVRTIKEHGFFDVDQNTYAYITEDNVASLVGDRFIKQKTDGTNTEVTLTGYEVTHEIVGSYSIQTAFNENFMVEGMLSMTGEDYRGRFEYFDIGEGMKYDEAKMQADIDRYGLYSYEQFSDYLTPEQFAMFNGAYFKVLVGKGVMTEEDIFGIIADNL